MGMNAVAKNSLWANFLFMIMKVTTSLGERKSGWFQINARCGSGKKRLISRDQTVLGTESTLLPQTPVSVKLNFLQAFTFNF